MDLKLTGKAAWVTGGGGGIGAAIATALADEGAAVALSGRTQSTLERAATNIRARVPGAHIISVVADVTDGVAVSAAARKIARELGSLDILVNCAAVPGGRVGPSIESVTDVDLLRELDEKLVGTFRACQAAVPFMKERSWGRLIHIGGLGARASGSYSSPRTLALVHLSKTFSDELGPYGITSNVVHPGATRGEWLAGRLAARADVSAAEAEAEMAAGYAIRRLLEPSEIAHVVAFLASPLSVAITGESIGTGGGGSRALTI
jgi:NAD(P)-dependent dehydrogenase (short-subunit alcohol dehydrogenase family)